MILTPAAPQRALPCSPSPHSMTENSDGSAAALHQPVRTWRAVIAALACAASFTPAAHAQDASYAISIQNHHFSPATVSVKAGQKIKLIVTNSGSKPAEFESAELNREKVIAGGSSAVIYVGPLEPGSYPFFDDFDPSNKGQIVAK